MSSVYLNILKSLVARLLGHVPEPCFVTYLVTWRCNCRCIFCSIWKKGAAKQEELSVEDAVKIFSNLKSLDVLRITGGEPFLRDDLAELINSIDALCSPAFIHITTNGFLTDRILSCINNIARPHKIHIKVSIDAIGEKHDIIRGIRGVYMRSMETVKELTSMARKNGMTVGINQAITDENHIQDYLELKQLAYGLGIAIYPVIAHDASNALYSQSTESGPTQIEFKTFSEFSPEAMEKCLRFFMDESAKNCSFSERIVDYYYQKGLYNRLVLRRNIPNPRCVALSNHLRILPNGDVPVCYFNNDIVGNLLETSWSTLKMDLKTIAMRRWIAKCPGCWESCEVIPSAVYSGDLVRGFFCVS